MFNRCKLRAVLPFWCGGNALIGGLIWWQQLKTTAQTPSVKAASITKSVAVLPFVNMSAEKENEYLSDGITEDLCTALSQIKGLHVPARTSSFIFKGRTEDIRKIGEQLNVGTVLEGSVRKGGNKLRIRSEERRVGKESRSRWWR